MKNTGMKAGSVVVISRAIIKPSSSSSSWSPTSRTFKLSFLDQLVPPFYVPVIFFYQPPTTHFSNAQIAQDLKESLSNALTLFHPLAGKLDPDNLAVHCNDDAGAEFIEARVHARLADVIQDPKMDDLINYLPRDPNTVMNSGDAAAAALLAVQVNYFDCGGMAVGICSSHQVADAASLMAFVGSWAEICRGRKGENCKLAAPPSFDLARHFPSRDLSGSGFSQSIYVKKEKLVTKRLVFDAEKLAALKRAASSTVKDPTRVEVVSAFIWQNLISEKTQLSAAWHVVNLRPRIRSQAIGDVFGNCILKHFVFSEGGAPEFHGLVRKLRDGLREINEEYVWKAGRDDDDYLKCVAKSFDLAVKGGMESCGFSSWSRFPVYEVDFGMGKPVWVCPTSCPEKNVCFLMGTKDGDGIELWVNVLESTSQILENKFHLIGKST